MDRSVSAVVLVLVAALGTACDSTGNLSFDPDGGSTGGGSTDGGRDSSAPPSDAGDKDGGDADGGTTGDPDPASCDDEVRNGGETDVDCGGSCGGCELTERCNIAGDCLSGYCGLKSCRAAGLYAFDDAYAPGVNYAPFSGQTGTVAIDSAQAYVGVASLRVDVPTKDYSGGSLQAPSVDLKGYDSLVFWAKASVAGKILDVVGFGADGAGDRLRVQRKGLPLTTTWTRFVVPIPDPSKMSATVDHFHFAEGSDSDMKVYSVWFDEIRFARLGDVLGTPQAELLGGPASLAPGGDFTVSAPVVRYTVEGAAITVEAGTGHFEFDSSDDKVATVDAEGKGKALVDGTAEITASLRGVKASGKRVITVMTVSTTAPSTAAPTPTEAAADVRSLFSGAYTNLQVDTFSPPDWDHAEVMDATAGTDPVKRYTIQIDAAIVFAPVDASTMDALHLDVWTPDATLLKVRLVDFGANGTYEPTNDNTQHELILNGSSTPTALATGTWVSFDLPLGSFNSLADRRHLAQLILSAETAGAGPATVFLDNVYFWRSPAAPSSAAPTPTETAGSVRSLFSGVYTDLPVNTFSASWDVADVQDAMVSGDSVKRYTNLAPAGIEFTSSTVDASTMDTLHLDVWTPDAALLKVKLVDFGVNGTYDPTNDNTEHEVLLNGSSTPTPLTTGTWVSFDLPLASFTGLTARGHLAQLILTAATASGGSATVFIDNLYFYDAP